MSYILEALKKSDQQRQRGTTPTLLAAQATVAAPKQTLLISYGLIAVMLLGAGIMIGWLRPWQPEQLPADTTVSGTEPVAAKSPIMISQQVAPAPLTEPPEMARMTAQEMSSPNSAPAVQSAPGIDAMKPDIAAPAAIGMTSEAVPVPEKHGHPADAVQEQRAIPMTELPLTVQQELPSMTVQLHAYSSKPSERLVSINSRMLREGGSLTPDIRLEQITPDGMIFSYKGYRFQRGIR